MEEGDYMRKTIRFAMFLGASFASLAFAGTALASFSPKLIVSSATPQAAGGGGAVRIGALVSNTDDPTARVSIYVPTGYQLTSPSPGTKLGDVTATASAADLGGAILPLTGQLNAIDPNTLTAAQKTGVAQCLQGATASQTWELNLTAAGQPIDIPVSVVAATANELASGYQTRLLICLPPPDVPATNPARAAFGAKLLSATFSASAITEPAASGDFRWTSAWTPYNPGVGTANVAGSVETQSVQHIPTQVKLNVTKKKVTTVKTKRIKGKNHVIKTVRTLVKFSSSVTENGTAAGSAVITTTAAGKKVGGASGSFYLASGKSATVKATAVVDSDSGNVPTGQPANAAADLFYHDLGSAACVKSAIFGGITCNDATLGGVTISAASVVKGYK
jgi:hypothetical protein